MGDKLERDYQSSLIKRLKIRFPGCIILKNDPDYIQGIPDLIILYGPHWAMLEVKKDEKASHRPNQDYYISKAKAMSYGSFIYPENEEAVLNEVQQAFKS